MQSFLPYQSFRKSMRSLDYRRLGKQRVEAMQMIRAIERLHRGETHDPKTGRRYGWQNHVCTRMWVNHLDALKVYHDEAILEWIRRGYTNNMERYFPDSDHPEREIFFTRPPWLSNPKLWVSHRSMLIQKEPDHYLPQWPNVPQDLPYWWPTEEYV